MSSESYFSSSSSSSSELSTMMTLLDEAFGDPEVNIVHFKKVETILYVLASHLRLMDRQIDFVLEPFANWEQSSSSASVTEVKIHAQVKKKGKDKGGEKEKEKDKGKAKGGKEKKKEAESKPDKQVDDTKEKKAKKSPSVATEGKEDKTAKKTKKEEKEDVKDKDKKDKKGKKETKDIMEVLASFEIDREKLLRVIQQRSDSREEPTKRPKSIAPMSETEVVREKLLVVEKFPKGKPQETGRARDKRAPDLGIVTMAQFNSLRDAVKKIQRSYNAALLDSPDFPLNEKLMDELGKGKSLSDAIAALQLSARVETAENMIDNLTDTMKKLKKHIPGMEEKLADIVRESKASRRGRDDSDEDEDQQVSRRQRDKGGDDDRDNRGGDRSRDRKAGAESDRKGDAKGRRYDDKDERGEDSSRDRKGRSDRGEDRKGGADSDRKGDAKGRRYDDEDDKGGDRLRDRKGRDESDRKGDAKGRRHDDEDDRGGGRSRDRKGGDESDRKGDAKERRYDDEDDRGGDRSRDRKGGADSDRKGDAKGRRYDDEDDRGGDRSRDRKGGAESDRKGDAKGRRYDDEDDRGGDRSRDRKGGAESGKKGDGKGGKYDDEDDRGGDRSRDRKAGADSDRKGDAKGRRYDDEDDRGGDRSRDRKGGAESDRKGDAKGRRYDDEDDRGGDRSRDRKGGAESGKKGDGKGGKYDDEDDRGGDRSRDRKAGADSDRKGDAKGRRYDDEDDRGGDRSRDRKGGAESDRKGDAKGRRYDDEDDRGGDRSRDRKGGAESGKKGDGKGGKYDDEDDRGGDRSRDRKGGPESGKKGDGKGGKYDDEDDRGGDRSRDRKGGAESGKKGDGKGGKYDDEDERGEDRSRDKKGGAASDRKGGPETGKKGDVKGGKYDDEDETEVDTSRDKKVRSGKGNQGGDEGIKMEGKKGDAQAVGPSGKGTKGKVGKQQGQAEGIVATKEVGTMVPIGEPVAEDQTAKTDTKEVEPKKPAQEDFVTRADFSTVVEIMTNDIKASVRIIANKLQNNANISNRVVNKIEPEINENMTKFKDISGIENQVTEYARKVNAIDKYLSSEMTTYQGKLSQMEYELEVGLEAFADALANQTTDPAAVADLLGKFEHAAEDLQGAGQAQYELLTEQNITLGHLKERLKEMNDIASVKADRDTVNELLRSKIGTEELNSYVDDQEFTAVCGDLQKRLRFAYNLFNKQEYSWQKDIDDIIRNLNGKADETSFEELNMDIVNNMDMLKKRLENIARILGEKPQIANDKKLIRDGKCLSCGTPWDLKTLFVNPEEDDDIQSVELPPLPKKKPSKSEAESETEMKRKDTDKSKEKRPCYGGLPVLHPPDPRARFCRRYCGGKVPTAIIIPEIRQITKEPKPMDRFPCIPCNRPKKKRKISKDKPPKRKHSIDSEPSDFAMLHFTKNTDFSNKDSINEDSASGFESFLSSVNYSLS